MWDESWKSIVLGPDEPPRLWELFHENCKTSGHEPQLSEEEVREWMTILTDGLRFDSRNERRLPRRIPPLDMPLGEAMRRRASSRRLQAGRIPLRQLATLLHHGYGITRSNADGRFPRPFRTVPSAGALFPLEIYVHATRVDGLVPGFYHYAPPRHSLCLLHRGSKVKALGSALVQRELARASSLVIFITAMFERSTFKYGDRGYRFILFEAGHVAQNIALAAAALHLGCVPIGGFLDRKIDDLLELDGVTHSTLYLLAVGGE